MRVPLALIGLDVRLEAALISGVVALLTSLLSTPWRYRFDRKLLDRRIRLDEDLALRKVQSDESINRAKLWADRELITAKLEVEQEYEQRKELRVLISRYRGRLVEASDRYHGRMANLYRNADKNWLRVSGDYQALHHYFHTSVVRFLTLMSLALGFERSAFFIESQYGKGDEIAFLWYCKIMRVVMTEVSLFEGMNYDASTSKDHFFHEQLREASREIDTAGDGADIGVAQLVRSAGSDALKPALLFFDGVGRGHDRLRWDRLVVLDLVTMAFLNSFGYPQQRSEPMDFIAVIKEVEHDTIRRNLRNWLEGQGLQRTTAPELFASLNEASS